MKTGRLGQAVHGGRQPREVHLLEESGTQSLRVDVGDRAEQAQDELLLAHLEAEDADRAALSDRGVLGDVERQRRLADGRPGGDDDQVRPLQPGRQGVEVLEAGSNAADLTLVLVQVVEAVVGRVKERS